MAETKVYGLKSLKMGNVLPSGEMQTAITELCRTYRDTCEFTEDDPEQTDEYADQSDDPVITFMGKGKKSIKVSTFDYSPEVLKKLKGGTIVNGQWAEPDVLPEIYQAVCLETDSDIPFYFPKARIFAKFNGKLQKKGLALLEITIVPQSPGAGKPAVLIGKKTG